MEVRGDLVPPGTVENGCHRGAARYRGGAVQPTKPQKKKLIFALFYLFIQRFLLTPKSHKCRKLNRGEKMKVLLSRLLDYFSICVRCLVYSCLIYRCRASGTLERLHRVAPYGALQHRQGTVPAPIAPCWHGTRPLLSSTVLRIPVYACKPTIANLALH